MYSLLASCLVPILAVQSGKVFLDQPGGINVPYSRTIKQVMPSGSPQSFSYNPIVVRPVPSPPSTNVRVVPIGEQSAPQSGRMAEKSCGGKRYLIPAERASYYDCCGTNIYYWITHKCTRGGVEIPPNPSPSQSQPIPAEPVPVATPAPVIPVPIDNYQVPPPSSNIQNLLATFPGSPPVSQPAPGNAGTATLTCNGVTFSFKSAQEMQQYVCCGKSIYKPANEQCNETSMNPINLQSFFPNIFNTNPFFGSRQYPQNNFVAPPYNPPPRQPAANIIVPDCKPRHTCCAGFKAVFDPDGVYRCCPGAGPYKPSESSCIPAS